MKKSILTFSAGLLSALVIILLVMPRGEKEVSPPAQKGKSAANTKPRPSSKGSASAPRLLQQSNNDSQSTPAVEAVLPPAKPRPVPQAVAGLLKALEHASDEERSTKIMEIAGIWTSKDPAGALAWAFSLEPGTDRVVVSIVLSDWGRADPDGAFESLRRLGPANTKLAEYATRRLFNQWSMDDPAAAWDAAGFISNPERLRDIEADILQHWSESDPITTAEILDRSIKAGSDLSGLTSVIESTANAYALKDPAAAARWSQSLPDGPSKSSAVSGLMNSWLAKDPQSASSWLRNLEPGETRDAGISTLVMANRNSDPQAAFLWAGNISNPQQRARLTQLAALSWLSISPDVARDELQRSSILTQSEKNTIFAIHKDSIAP